MAKADRWLLPDGVEELLPPQASQLEFLRRRILDLYHSWGYELVIPPLIEFLDSLLIGSGTDLNLQTFKVTDQISGRMMGIRADITSQVARIDAQTLRRNGPVRLCYAATVLRTRPSGLMGSRCPIQAGVELYGHSGSESDVEVLSLMLETLSLSGLKNITIALGHMGIFRELVKGAGLEKKYEEELFDILQRKAITELEIFLSNNVNDKRVNSLIRSLANLNGDSSILDEAENVFANGPQAVKDEITELRKIVIGLQRKNPTVNLYFDLSELRGYHYHTGVVFAAYVEGVGQAIAKGGRYDNIGNAFGRARSATGFDVDLKKLLELTEFNSSSVCVEQGICAPADEDELLWNKIQELRAQGKRVVCALPGATLSADDCNCDHRLVHKSGQWHIESVDNE